MHLVFLRFLLGQGIAPGLIAGTSVGALVGGGFALSPTLSQLDKINTFFTNSAPDIFTSHWYQNWCQAGRLAHAAHYGDTPLIAALTALYGNATLADCVTPFIATGFEMTTGRIAYFQSYGKSEETNDDITFGPDSGFKLVDVMCASAAAQSYFPGHAIGKYLFWDGGSSGFNAPDMLAYEEAKELTDEADIEMYSLGSGRTPWPYAGQDMTNPGLVKVLQATMDIAYSGPESAMVWLAKRQIGSRHHRFDPVIPDFGIDDASPATLAAMVSAAQATLNIKSI